MKISFDLGGKDASEQDRILARAYVAAVVGPFRRPQGRVKFAGPIAAGATVEIAKNSTPDRVLFVSVNNVSPAQVQAVFAVGGDSNSATSLQLGSAGFILLPGEQLVATAPVVGLNLSVTENVF